MLPVEVRGYALSGILVILLLPRLLADSEGSEQMVSMDWGGRNLRWGCLWLHRVA